MEYRRRVAERMYRELKEECIEPFERRASVYPEYAEDEEERKEIEKIVKCAKDYMDRYARFAAGAMDDFEISKFYTDVVKGFERAIETKEEQYRRAHEEIEDIRRELEEDKAIYCEEEETKDDYMCEVTLERLGRLEALERQLNMAEKEDMSVMKATLNTCKVAKDRTEKALCIDSVFNLVHTRGTVLPLMCGAPLEEYVREAVYGEEYEHPTSAIGNVAVDMAKDTMDALTCIRNFVPRARRLR